ncbi:MAG: GAF domain-containing protein [Myxococcales bacterium]|nr:GAF domain-containing protein [Myxococcales bacterium]
MSGREQGDVMSQAGAILDAVARAADRIHAACSVAEALPDVLAILGPAAGVSRVYVFEHVAHVRDDARIRQRFEWCAPGVEPQIDNPDLQDADLVAMGYGRWVRELTAGRAIVGDVADFPEEERPILEAQSIRSVLVQPIFAGKYWWGFIGFDACDDVRAWHPVEIDSLRVAAQVCGLALALESRDAFARHAYKMEALGRMASGVAHDVNNLLAIMQANVDLLRRGEVDVGERLFELNHAIDQASRLSRELLAFGRPADARAPLTEPLEALRNVEGLLRRVAGRAVRLELDAEGEIAPVRIAPSQLEQIALNLVTNARDAMSDGGVILLLVRTLDASEASALGDELPAGRYTLLSVRDSGHGIPVELHDRVFEPFFTTKESGQGTGLGLATIYGAVSAAGGAVRLTSAAGEGTEVRIYLPVA